MCNWWRGASHCLLAAAMLMPAIARATPTAIEPEDPTSAQPAAPSVREEMQGLDLTGTPALPPKTNTLHPAQPPLQGKRKMPSYGGRPDQTPTLGQGLIWVPRAVFFPVHLTTEYVLRRPIVAGITAAEEHFVLPRLQRLFTWREGRAGFYPVFAVDIGLRPTAGVAIFARELFHKDNDFKLSSSVSTNQLLLVRAQNRLRVFRDRAGSLYLRGEFMRRPDGVYHGPGNDADNDDRTFFLWRRAQLSTGLEGDLGGLNRVYVDFAYRDMDFSGSDFSDDTPDLRALYGGLGQQALPEGFGGYQLLHAQVRFVLDSRDPISESYRGSGVRLELDGGAAFDPGNSQTRFVPWGIEGVGFYDFTGYNHALGLRVAARFVEDIGDNPVPFYELVSLGGLETMRGSLQGRFRGESGFIATLQYRYPIYAFADAELFSGVGNTFPGHLKGFEVDRLYWNYGISLRTNYSRDSSISMTVGFGSNRFDADDFRPADFFRFFFGLNQGF